MSLQQFLACGQPNAWIVHDRMSLYVRSARHWVQLSADHPGGVVRTFDLANLDTPEYLRGQGRFWRLIEHLKHTLPSEYQALYVENVQNERLRDSLRARGIPEIVQHGLMADWPTFVYWRT